MELEKIPGELTVCKVTDYRGVDLGSDLCFIGRTDEENSLVCRTEDVPPNTTEREDGWRAFRIRGVLAFSLTGILSRIAGLLAENGIGIFAVSTYNTDYVLVKKENFDRALEVLAGSGCRIF